VFYLSQLAVEQVITSDVHTSAPSILTAEDKTILTVLAEAGRALLHSEIVREAARLVKDKRGTSARAMGLVTLSETKLGERVPILEEQGLLSRPPGAKGKPSQRKGIGITEKGRAQLNFKS
jgi:hypothetical protein